LAPVPDDALAVLIVDNDAAIRRILTKIVESMGLRAVTVERATRALQVLDEQPIAAMLLDLHMPGPHGDDLLRLLRKREQRDGAATPPVIVVSGYLQRERLRGLLRLGVQAVVAKPFDLSRVERELQRALAGPVEPPAPARAAAAPRPAPGAGEPPTSLSRPLPWTSNLGRRRARA